MNACLAGVFGLGAMGAPMAENLHRAGLLGGFWNRSPERAAALAERLGRPPAADAEALAAGVEVLLLSLSADADVTSLLERLHPVLRPGQVVVDTSTTHPDTARRLAARLDEAGVGFLDAPVSGGVEGARRGTLAMMVGGEPEMLARVRPVLEVISARIAHLGPVGSGQATKAVNQVIAAGINQAVCQGLALAEALGLPLDRVIEVVGGGAAGNWFLTHRGPTLVQGRFEPGFRVALHRKDLDICARLAEGLGLELSLVRDTLADYAWLETDGHGDEDISALYRLKRAMRQADED